MLFKNKKNVSFKLLVFNSLTFILIIYFIYHALNGDRGLFAHIKLKKNLSDQIVVLNALVDQRKELEKVTQGLNPKQIDKDVLDEFARKELGLIGANEKMIVLNFNKRNK